MRLSVIAVKLTNGRELLCGVPESMTVDFGIMEYPNKIPRKTFLVNDNGTQSPPRHTLTVYEVHELYAMQNTVYLNPLLLSNPRLAREGNSLTLHSNDVFALSTAVDPSIAHLWFNRTNQVNEAQSPSHLLTNISN